MFQALADAATADKTRKTRYMTSLRWDTGMKLTVTARSLTRRILDATLLLESPKAEKMKNILFVILLLGISVIGFAQTSPSAQQPPPQTGGQDPTKGQSNKPPS